MSHFSPVRLVCALLCVSVLPAHAAILHVAPSGSDNGAGTSAAPYAAVQAAVNNAKAGDTVALRAGTYSGSGNRDIDFGGKALTVKSDSGAAQTILDCGGSEGENHRGFFVHGNVGGARVEGLTIKNGFPNDSHSLTFGDKQGAGAFIERGSRAAFVNCVFSNDSGLLHTGGAVNNMGRVTLTGCTFDGNPSSGLINYGTATVSGCKFQNNTAYIGGDILNAVILTLMSSTFSDNTCEGIGSAGGGLYIKLDPFGGIRATVTGCTFSGNQAQDGAAVNGFFVNLTDCIFALNTAAGSGGAVLLMPNARCAMTRCKFIGNKAAVGGGILAFQFSHLTLTNCVFGGNSAGNGSGGGVSSISEMTARFCTFTQNVADGPNARGGAIANGGKIGQYTDGSPSLSTSHCDIEGGQSGPGNIKSDPHFTGTSSFHLAADSPCRRAGIAVSGVATDADKKPRSSPPSVGAYE